MNERQAKVIQLLDAAVRRDIYESGQPPSMKHGSGKFFVTYSAGEVYEPLLRDDIQELLANGVIQELYASCYSTPHNISTPNRYGYGAKRKTARLPAEQRVRDAAPAMLDALTSAMAWDTESNAMPDWLAEKVDAAIAAATGQAQPTTTTEPA